MKSGVDTSNANPERATVEKNFAWTDFFQQIEEIVLSKKSWFSLSEAFKEDQRHQHTDFWSLLLQA